MSSGQLRVTTFNILAPVWVSPGIYPKMDMEEFNADRRRGRLLESILALDPDILFMQECQKSELDKLMEERDGVLNEKYNVNFCGFPLTFWTNWLTEFGSNMTPQENGVCILTKKSAVKQLNVQRIPIDLPEWKEVLPESSLGAHACFVTLEIPSWSDKAVLLATSHLDADSAHRAGLQGNALADKILAEGQLAKVGSVIWGGDFNMAARNHYVRAICRKGFTFASGLLGTPTVYSAMGTVRVDHVLHSSCGEQAIRSVKTEVDKCPHGHCIPVYPFLTELQWLVCSLKGEKGCCCRLIGILLLLLIVPVLILAFPIIIYVIEGKQVRRRLSWALATWGSDHLPVTVTLEACAGTPRVGLDGT